MKKEQTGKCDPCEQNFERNVNHLVKEGTAPTHAERTKKEHEVKDAFAEHKAKSTKEPAMASTARKK